MERCAALGPGDVDVPVGAHLLDRFEVVVVDLAGFGSSGAADPRLPVLLLTATPGAVVDTDALAWVREHAASLSTADLGAAEHVAPQQQPAAIAEAVTAWAQRRDRAA